MGAEKPSVIRYKINRCCIFGLAQAIGHDDRAAHHLFGVLGVHAQSQVDLDALIELGVFDFLQQRHGFLKRIIARLDLLGRGLILFSWLMCHNSSLVQTARPRSADLPLSVFGGHLRG
jgi:hypothetical protein